MHRNNPYGLKRNNMYPLPLLQIRHMIFFLKFNSTFSD
nr:MAG TPA: hypothetical protein [Caudoviricetes sp.]